MTALCFADARKVSIIQLSQNGTTVSENYREAGISWTIDFNQKKKLAGMMPPEMTSLREHEPDNADPKTIIVDLMLTPINGVSTTCWSTLFSMMSNTDHL